MSTKLGPEEQPIVVSNITKNQDIIKVEIVESTISTFVIACVMTVVEKIVYVNANVEVRRESLQGRLLWLQRLRPHWPKRIEQLITREWHAAFDERKAQLIKEIAQKAKIESFSLPHSRRLLFTPVNQFELFKAIANPSEYDIYAELIQGGPFSPPKRKLVVKSKTSQEKLQESQRFAALEAQEIVDKSKAEETQIISQTNAQEMDLFSNQSIKFELASEIEAIYSDLHRIDASIAEMQESIDESRNITRSLLAEITRQIA